MGDTPEAVQFNKYQAWNKAENADFQSYAAGKAILECLKC